MSSGDATDAPCDPSRISMPREADFQYCDVPIRPHDVQFDFTRSHWSFDVIKSGVTVAVSGLQ